VTETARVLLVATFLAGSGFGLFVWRLGRLEANEPARLIGELRFSHWMALTLAATGGAWIGLAAGRPNQMMSGVDLTLAIAATVAAAWSMQRETRSALTILSLAFLAHAVIDAAHRPGWLATDLAPRWFTLGCAATNLYFSALCFLAQRR
jgi:uncharacterized membrane protein YhdT